MADLQETPARMVEDGEVVAFGLFKKEFREVNIDRAQIYAPLPLPAPLLRLRLKEWQHFAVISDEFFMGFVVNDNHYVGMSFCYVFDRHDAQFTEHHRQSAAGAARVARELWRDACSFVVKGYSIGIENLLEESRHCIHIDIRPDGARPAIRAELELREDIEREQPLVTVLPIGGNRPLYTHKHPCPVSGYVSVGAKRYELDPARHIALIDVQKTYYPYNTFWNWATFAGYTASGERLAVNLVQNIIGDDERYNENVFWADGRLSHLSAVRFDIPKRNFLSEWRIETTDGRCRLIFRPEGERAERLNYGVVLSNYHAPYGKYSGEITDNDGRTHGIEGLYGVAEMHRARF